MESVGALLVGTEHINAFLCEDLHDVAVAAQTRQPKSVDARHLVSVVDVHRLIHQHQIHHLNISLGHRTEQGCLWSKVLVILRLFFEVKVNSVGASEVDEELEIEGVDGGDELVLEFGELRLALGGPFLLFLDHCGHLAEDELSLFLLVDGGVVLDALQVLQKISVLRLLTPLVLRLGRRGPAVLAMPTVGSGLPPEFANRVFLELLVEVFGGHDPAHPGLLGVEVEALLQGLFH